MFSRDVCGTWRGKEVVGGGGGTMDGGTIFTGARELTPLDT